MNEHARVVRFGDATLTILELGEVNFPLAGCMNLPASEVAAHAELRSLAEQVRLPVYTFHVRLPGTALVVDPGVYDFETHPTFGIPGYLPPPELSKQLMDLGLRREDVQHVIITHCHWDHFNGTTTERGGQWVPKFPHARHYVGRADWEDLEAALNDPESGQSKTLGVLQRHNLLEIVDGDRDLGNGVRIVAAPGESAGHQIVRVHSAGETLYCLGDLYHHSDEVSHPDLRVDWADAATSALSRQSLIRHALEENALLVATHIPGVGRLRRVENRIDWETV